MSLLKAVAAKRIFEALGGPLPAWGRVEMATTPISIATGGYLFHAEDPQPYVHCVRRGLVKLAYEMSDGKEWIKGFSYEGAFFASAAALEPGGRAGFSVVAMEPSVIERIDYLVLLQLAERAMCWQRLLRLAFQLYGAKKEKRERELLTLSAEQRYRLFVEEHAALENRVPQKDLARYLGVTPVGLSRIKGRLRRGHISDGKSREI
jgi:CRP-like cAMP-binding protein